MNNKNKPLVSVPVLTYNSSKYVLETLESIKAQTYDLIELIVSDDCSSDKTVEICKKWIAENRTRFVGTHLITSDVNTGISANKNRALAKCTGEWVKGIAGDDLLLENCIRDNVEFVNSRKNDIYVVSSIRLRFFVNRSGRKEIIHPGNGNIFFHPEISVEDQYQLALRRISPSPNTLFIKKEVFKDVGGYDEAFPMCEDRPFLLRALIGGYKFYWLEKETVLYRMHEESVWHKDAKKFIYKKWGMESAFPIKYKYVYPHISFFEKVIMDYQKFIADKTIQLGLNKRTNINWFINKLLAYPADLLFRFNRNRVRKHFEKKYL